MASIMGNMIASLLRPRRRDRQGKSPFTRKKRINQHLTPTQDIELQTQKPSSTVFMHTRTVDVDKPQRHNSQTEPLNSETQVSRLRQKLQATKHALEQLETIVDSLDPSTDGFGEAEEESLLSPENSLNIDRHLADLQSTTAALNTFLAKFAQSSTGQSNLGLFSSPTESVENPRCERHLRTPDLGNSFAEQVSIYSEDDPLYRILSTPSISEADFHFTPLTTPEGNFPYVAPLRLPARNISTRSTSAVDRSHWTISTPQHLCQRTLSLGTGHSRPAYIDTLFPDASPQGRPLSCSSPYGSPTFQRRQFSTEDKTRRLRSLAAAKASPPWNGPAAGDPEAGLDEQDGGAGGTTLRMDELLSFLRDGNSMRQL